MFSLGQGQWKSKPSAHMWLLPHLRVFLGTERIQLVHHPGYVLQLAGVDGSGRWSLTSASLECIEAYIGKP